LSGKCIFLYELNLAFDKYLLILQLGYLVIDIPLKCVESLGEALHAFIQREYQLHQLSRGVTRTLYRGNGRLLVKLLRVLEGIRLWGLLLLLLLLRRDETWLARWLEVLLGGG
jgi:hypothetical protein